ncbi:MAG: hypothetical protein R3E50_06040 [Halioglobus sp.]
MPGGADIQVLLQATVGALTENEGFALRGGTSRAPAGIEQGDNPVTNPEIVNALPYGGNFPGSHPTAGRAGRRYRVHQPHQGHQVVKIKTGGVQPDLHLAGAGRYCFHSLYEQHARHPARS